MRELKPKALNEPKPGVSIYDMAQNMVGWVRLTVNGPVRLNGTEHCVVRRCTIRSQFGIKAYKPGMIAAFNWFASEKQSLTLGGDLAHTWTESNFLGSPTVLDAAIFAQDEIQATSGIKVNAGLRLDHHKASTTGVRSYAAYGFAVPGGGGSPQRRDGSAGPESTWNQRSVA